MQGVSKLEEEQEHVPKSLPGENSSSEKEHIFNIVLFSVLKQLSLFTMKSCCILL